MKTTMMMLMLAAGAIGCGSSSNGGDGGMGSDMAASTFPSAPTVGATLDRMGRAAVNTALTDPFYTDKNMHNAKLDAYNKAPRAMWQSFAGQFAAALAAYDGLDGKCDNQPLADTSGAADGGAAGEYMALASILADDELLLDTTAAGCDPSKNYLAVEVGLISKAAPASCGGRTPLDNAIDVTYAAVSGGIFSGVPVVNGVTADGDTANTATLSAFPFLGAPL